jgi:prephenate dehydrogenase
MIAVPIDKTLNIISEIKDHINPNSCIFDITSIKSKPLKAMLKTKAKDVV